MTTTTRLRPSSVPGRRSRGRRRTRTVRVSGATAVITDGPLAETKEHFAGYLIVDCESLARAEEIAARWPSTPFAPIEAWPIMEIGGPDM
jgi:hypothetical protein